MRLLCAENPISASQRSISICWVSPQPHPSVSLPILTFQIRSIYTTSTCLRSLRYSKHTGRQQSGIWSPSRRFQVTILLPPRIKHTVRIQINIILVNYKNNRLKVIMCDQCGLQCTRRFTYKVLIFLEHTLLWNEYVYFMILVAWSSRNAILQKKKHYKGPAFIMLSFSVGDRHQSKLAK